MLSMGPLDRNAPTTLHHMQCIILATSIFLISFEYLNHKNTHLSRCLQRAIAGANMETPDGNSCLVQKHFSLVQSTHYAAMFYFIRQC